MQPLLRNLLVLGLLPSVCTIAAGQLTAPLSTQDAIDVLEIQQMINLYATAADQQRLDLLPQIFTPDVTVDFNTPGVPILYGLPAVTRFMAAALRDVKSYHAQSTHYINLTNAAAPRATTYNSATFFAGQQQRQVITRLGRYEDDLVRSTAGWRISSRALIITGDTGNALALAPGETPVTTF